MFSTAKFDGKKSRRFGRGLNGLSIDGNNRIVRESRERNVRCCAGGNFYVETELAAVGERNHGL